jgi:cyclic dehypoxanthinyl futalosine synthase
MRHNVLTRVADGGRIQRADAAWLATEASDADLQRAAATVRARFHPADEATWLTMAIVNTTNVCVARCDYCAFYVLPNRPGAYLLTVDEISARIERLLALGGTLVSFNGGFHPKLRIADYARMFSEIHARFPHLAFYELTVAEFLYAATVSQMTPDEAARALYAAGTRWVTGGGAEVLAPSFRERHSPLKSTVDAFFDGQRALLRAGIGTTATMVIGFDETIDERLEHLERLRRFQDEVRGALPSFLCWTYKPHHTALGGAELPTADYLRWLAVCRIYLDNFRHIRTSVLTRNDDALLGLRWGADDFDLPTEDEVTQKAGATISLDFERTLDAARRLGIDPRHRAPFSPMPAPR